MSLVMFYIFLIDDQNYEKEQLCGPAKLYCL